MTIRKFLIIISGILLVVGGYFNVKYIKETEIEEKNTPIDNYFIVDKFCSSSYKGSSFVKINFNGKKYNVNVPLSDCPNITEEYFKSKLYYIKDTDEVLFKGYSVSRGISFLCYVAGLAIPLIGFVVYRRELDNHYSTM